MSTRSGPLTEPPDRVFLLPYSGYLPFLSPDFAMDDVRLPVNALFYFGSFLLLYWLRRGGKTAEILPPIGPFYGPWGFNKGTGGLHGDSSFSDLCLLSEESEEILVWGSSLGCSPFYDGGLDMVGACVLGWRQGLHPLDSL